MTDSDGGARDSPRRYRNPPVEHRFRKGVSGNPKGRPRKERVLVGTKIGGEPRIGFEDRVRKPIEPLRFAKAIGSRRFLSSRLLCANSPSLLPMAIFVHSKYI
jgi:hypothetical protein